MQPDTFKVTEVSRSWNPAEMPLKRRFPSQDPALYQNENRDHANVNQGRPTYHNHIHSDLPLQMPNLTDREAEKMRPSMYGGVMSGPGAVTTAGTLLGDH